MTYQLGEILLEKYRVVALIGSGAFGDVYRVHHISLGVARALKVLRRNDPGGGSSDYNESRQCFCDACGAPVQSEEGNR